MRRLGMATAAALVAGAAIGSVRPRAQPALPRWRSTVEIKVEMDRDHYVSREAMTARISGA